MNYIIYFLVGILIGFIGGFAFLVTILGLLKVIGYL